MLASGEAKPSLIKRTSMKRINKKFKSMTETEKKQHIRYLWNLVRHSVQQRATMKFLSNNLLSA